ncbi:MAG: alpha-amylase [Treponema sp.]|nr:alpha-amylase [Treponema sp.]
MHISYNEFHISKKVRDLCSFEEGLFASSGNVVFANMRNVRNFQLLYNNYIDTVTGDENKRVSAGQLNAMGLIDEILHHVCMLYRRNKVPTFMKDLLAELDKQFTKKEIDSLLIDFINEFPPVEVYKEKCSAREYLTRTALDIGTNEQRSNREQTLEELVLLHLANENAAFKPFLLLFGDTTLTKNKLYGKTWTSIKKYAKSQPSFGPFDHDLINLLKEPQAFAPDSLKGQLEYIQKYWGEFLGEWLKRILAGMDTISEEEKAAWHGFGGGDLPDMAAYTFENLMNEYERYSPDSDWMPKVILIAKTVLVWLDQLTKQYGYPITRLDQIPDPELDKLRDEGFTGLWLIGLWERSKASRRIKQICGNPEAAASAYSLYDYNIAQNIGGWDALANLRQRLWQRGIRLASDMVPNHTGMDGDWVINRPDLFIQRRDCPFPHYTFNGENLSQDGRVSLYLEDHYYSKNDCSVVFKRVDNQTGDTRYIYHGNDGTGLPWNDTAQIDFLNPEAREAVMQEILHVAQNFPIIRFDAAMVLAKKSIRRLWYPEPGHGGDIATRSETGLSYEQFNAAIPNEFWREVVDRVARECPDTLLLAEAFWMMEGYFVRTLGMHRVYNSAFMNMLKKEENQKYRETVKNTITFDPQVLKRYVNFMNNPDEETAIAQFGDGDKYFGVCTLMITMPGLPMFGHGQIEGFTEKYGMEYTKAYKDEKPSQYLVDRHWREIFPLMKKRYLFSGVENFLFYDLWQDGAVNENVFAYSNGSGQERVFVVYNNKYDRAYGWIKQSDPYAVKTGNGEETTLTSRSISEGLNLNGEDDKYCIFREHKSNLWFIRKSSEICEKGLFVMLNGFEYQVYLDVHQVTDEADHRYKILCEHLNGAGCEDIESAWQDIIFKDLYAAMESYAKLVLPPLLEAFTDKVSTSDIKKILTDADKQARAFEKECLKIEKSVEGILKKKPDSKTADKAKKASSGTCALTTENLKLLKLLAQVHNAKAVKKPADLQKTLLKAAEPEQFIKLMTSADENLEALLICRALCGKFAYTGLAEGLNFARKLNQFIADYTELNKNLRPELTKLFLLARVSDASAIATPAQARTAAARITELLVISKYRRVLSGANLFDNIWWFNKEVCDNSINQIELLMLMNAKSSEAEKVFKLFKEIRAAKLKAAYKCELFIKEFAPKKKEAPAKKAAASKKTAESSKKPAAPKKTAAAKKTAAPKKATTSKKKASDKKASDKKSTGKKNATSKEKK